MYFEPATGRMLCRIYSVARSSIDTRASPWRCAKDSIFDYPHHPAVPGGPCPGVFVLSEELSGVLPLLLHRAAAKCHQDLQWNRASWPRNQGLWRKDWKPTGWSKVRMYASFCWQVAIWSVAILKTSRKMTLPMMNTTQKSFWFWGQKTLPQKRDDAVPLGSATANMLNIEPADHGRSEM